MFNMHLILTILAFLIIFSVLILIHEFGHFSMAKRNGIKVEEFGFGLPPRIFGIKRGETLYSINWIPFGGFVRMLGENPSDKKAKSKQSFMSKSIGVRTKVVLAGVVMNFLLAWILLNIGFTVGMQPLIVDGNDFLNGIRNNLIELNFDLFKNKPAPDPNSEIGQIVDIPQLFIESTVNPEIFQPGDQIYSINKQIIFEAAELQQLINNLETPKVTFEIWRNNQLRTIEYLFPQPHRAIITQILPDSPAEQAGLVAGDQVIRVDGKEIWHPEQIVRLTSENSEKQLIYEIKRNDEIKQFSINKNSEGRIGVALGSIYDQLNLPFSYYDGLARAEITAINSIQYPWYLAPWQSLVEMKRITIYTAVMLGDVFKNIFTTGSVPEGVAGPIGIAQMTGIYVQEGIIALLRFTALLSLSLAVINVFPFPALDGGRFLFIIIEAVRGKPVNQNMEAKIHTLGFLFLILVIILVTFQDLKRLFE